MATISLQVDTDLAQAYNNCASQRQQQIQIVFNILLKRSLEEDNLENIIANIRQEAKSNGLTSEILEKLLAND